MSNETHCRHCGEQSTQTTCGKCENAAISVEFRRRKDALAKCFPPIDWKARCEKAEAAAETAKQNALAINELWAKEIARVGELEAELAAIKGKVEWAYQADGGGIIEHCMEMSARHWCEQYPGYTLLQRTAAGPWTTAEPRAGEMTKEQK